MSDEGEKTCPLCAEEMDLTDQQLRPCKCGYDICVWCWHHIMDMAEKDGTEGRCPACRTPYNKEKIVGTASKCERLVAEMSVEKKQKSVKGKSKTYSEGRKQLSSVRVIQRNLVYIVGLPLNLADEDLLQRKEYFGQYGKVVKVSISRTAAGSIQHFANSTCSVYITYSKEEEAVRSIQAVHGFVLEGRPLRACFGTTKYCHAWLRNMACTNPECLYLHEFGSQEDSFTKDEIISEYTRGRVQQVTTGGATNDTQRRSGNYLPPAPAADDYYYTTTSSWAKPTNDTTTTTTNSMKGSPPSSSSGRSSAPLPAAASWGTHASNSHPLLPLVANGQVSSNGPSKQKPDTSTTTTFSTAVVTSSLHANEIVKNHSEESKVEQQHPESSATSTTTTNSHVSTASPDDKNQPNSSSRSYMQSSDIAPDDKDLDDVSDEDKLSTEVSSLSIGIGNGRSHHGLQPPPLASNKPPNKATMDNNSAVTREQVSYFVPDKVEEEEEVGVSEGEADLLSFNDERLRDPQLVTPTNTHTSYIQHNDYSPFGNQRGGGGSLFNTTTLNTPPPVAAAAVNGDSFFQASNINGHSYFPAANQMGRSFDDDTAKRDHNSSNGDLGENSIISNILSMDFDPWDDSLTSPQNLAKLLGNTDHKKQQTSQLVSSRKTQSSSNQSRFSFAREEEDHHQASSNFTQNPRDFHTFNRDYDNGFSPFNFEESPANHSSKVSVSRSQISAPPGFMGPSRAPPPGFTSNETRIIEQQQPSFDNLSGNHHMFDTSSILRKMHHHHHQAPAAHPVYNNGNGGGVSELELMDPAILAIGGTSSRLGGGGGGGGLDMMRSSNFPSQHASFENDNNNRLRLLMQTSRSFTHQNQRFSSELGDGYGVPSRILDSSYQAGFHQQPRMSNGHWDGWNEVQNGNAMAELLRNERLGFNKYYSGL